MKRVVAVVALAASLGAAPAAAPSQRYPAASATALGSLRYLAENDADAAVSGVQIFIAAGLDREAPQQNGVSALVAESLLRTPIDGEPLREAIAGAGGSLNYTVDGRSVHYYLEGRSERLAALVRIFGRALAAPDFSSATVAAGRAALTARLAEFEGSPLSVGIQMFRRSYYTGGAGQPALGNATTLAGLGGADLTAFYRANYLRSAVTASAVGRIGSELGTALEGVADGLAPGAPAAVAEKARSIPAEAPRIVAHRDVGAPWVVVGFAAPSPNSRDFGAMLVLESLLSSAFERSSATTPGLAQRSVGAFYLYESSPASVVVYVNGQQIDPSLALREVLAVSKTLALKPLGAPALARFKTSAEGQFLTDSVDLSDRAYLLGTFASQGLGDDAINAALVALEKTTPADVQRVAKSYLQRYIVALVLPRGGSGGR